VSDDDLPMQNDTSSPTGPAWNAVAVLRTDLEAWCARAELPPPPADAGLSQRILQIGEGLFASWEPATPPYAFAELMAEAWAKAQDGDWLFGVDGHGVQSWALHWVQRRGALLLGFQVRVGGAFAPAELDLEAVKGAWGLVGRLDAALARAEAASRLPAGKMLVVIDTDLGANRYAWLAKGEPWDRAGWREDPMAAFAALMELEDLAGQAGPPLGARREAGA
jgi:hypothetical protein